MRAAAASNLESARLRSEERTASLMRKCLLTLVAVLLIPLALTGKQEPTAAPPNKANAASASEFKRLVTELLRHRTGTGESNDEAARLQGSALEILDSIVLDGLNAASGPSPETLRQQLSGLAGQTATVGQGYELIPLGGTPEVYSLAANFGSSGPSAVRLYASSGDQYRLAGRIDVVAQADYFDDHLTVLPLANSSTAGEIVFLTVTGRTDEYLTGVFAAWKFASGKVQEIWATDLMPHSTYEVRSDGIEIKYCSEAVEDNPQACARMARERYAWSGSVWKRVEQTDLGPPKS